MKTTFRKSFTRDLKEVKDRAILGGVKTVIEEVEGAATLQDIVHLKKRAGASNC